MDASDTWDAAGHTFKEDIAEGLFKGWMDKAGGGVEKRDEVGMWDSAQELDSRGEVVGMGIVIDGGVFGVFANKEEFGFGVLLTEEGEGLKESGDILAAIGDDMADGDEDRV